jgi:thiosulfate reductase cytochrome b subunit
MIKSITFLVIFGLRCFADSFLLLISLWSGVEMLQPYLWVHFVRMREWDTN